MADCHISPQVQSGRGKVPKYPDMVDSYTERQPLREISNHYRGSDDHDQPDHKIDQSNSNSSPEKYPHQAPPPSVHDNAGDQHRGRKKHDRSCDCKECRLNYELPAGYEHDLRIINKLSAGHYGATAKVEVLDSSITAAWYRCIKSGTTIVAKRICMTPNDHFTDLSFSREVRALKRVRGGMNILQIFGYEQPVSGDPWGHIFTEYCSMGDVMSLFIKYDQKDEYMPEGFLCQFMSDMGRALGFLQSGTSDPWVEGPEDWVPILHNDIKPDNVLMKPQRRRTNSIYPIFVLGDLGQASYQGGPGEFGAIPITSPERYRAEERGGSPADDMYSLGVTLFFLANKFFPFDTTSSKAGGCPVDFSRRKPSDSPYSSWLHVLAESCSSRGARQRPTAFRLIECIEEQIEEKGCGIGGSRTIRWPTDWLQKDTEGRQGARKQR
ncbi:hypothetical protein ABW21_db0205158 [Orbilia brochopaga]|nr:hypothetical protein ABW21_db0205158 [Drechslerella brochopaga]